MPTKSSLIAFLSRRIPIITWLPKYKWSYLVDDLISGITITSVVIPQGLAYAVLATLPPVYGLYVAMIPPAIYILFGTSPYNCIGTFAIMSILLGEGLSLSLSLIDPKSILPLTTTQFSVLLAILVSFIIDLIQLVVSLIGIGDWMSRSLFPPAMIKGFTSAGAITILTNQLKPLLGMPIPKYIGPFNLIQTWVYALSHLYQVHWITLVIGCVTIFMIIGIRAIERFIRYQILRRKGQEKNLKMLNDRIFPEVLFTICVVGLVCTAIKVWPLYGVAIIGSIPKGFPAFTVPWALAYQIPSSLLWKILPRMIPTIISMTLVSIVILSSIINTFPTDIPLIDEHVLNDDIALPVSKSCTNEENCKEKTKMGDIDQEIFAVSVAGLVGSFFQCYTPTGSLTKSAIMFYRTNVHSPIAILVKVLFIMAVVAFLTSWFENLPLATLAGVIFVALSPVAARALFIKDLIATARNQRFSSQKNAQDPIDDSSSDSSVSDCTLTPDDAARLELKKIDADPSSDRIKKVIFFTDVWSDTMLWSLTFLSVLVIDIGTGVYVGLASSVLLVAVKVGLKKLDEYQEKKHFHLKG